MLVAIAGPSGAGKSTMINAIVELYTNAWRLPSYTTRPPRKGEQAGELTFIPEEQFQETKAAGHFVWDAQPYGTYRYGTLHRDLRQALLDDERVYLGPLTIDVFERVYQHPEYRYSRVCFVYLHLDDRDELRRRLWASNRNNIEERLASAPQEFEQALELQRKLPIHIVNAVLAPIDVCAAIVHAINLHSII